MKSIEVTIKGKSGLMMHRYPMEPVEGLDKKTKEEQAEVFAYRIPQGAENAGNLYIPGSAIQRALINGATFSHGKGRATLQKIAAACLFVEPEYVDLGVKTYIIDSRTVVVPATKGRIIRHRPLLLQWQATFTLLYDELLLDEKQVRKIVDDTLERVGLLEYRPAKTGPFGRAMVTGWSPVVVSTEA